jgi:hypothetical protein
MVVGDHVGYELGQSLFDLSGTQFHNALHSLALWGVPRRGDRSLAGHSRDPT